MDAVCVATTEHVSNPATYQGRFGILDDRIYESQTVDLTAIQTSPYLGEHFPPRDLISDSDLAERLVTAFEYYKREFSVLSMR